MTVTGGGREERERANERGPTSFVQGTTAVQEKYGRVQVLGTPVSRWDR